MMKVSTSVIRLLLGLCLTLGVLVSGVAQAQALRDPTQAPSTATDSIASSKSASPATASGMAVLVRDGVPYLVSGTRLYAKGQTLGAARIVKITETQVWLREAGVVRKLPVFTGVERRASASAPAASKPKNIAGVPPPTKP